jgi:hypothetical protein
MFSSWTGKFSFCNHEKSVHDKTCILHFPNQKHIHKTIQVCLLPFIKLSLKCTTYRKNIFNMKCDLHFCHRNIFISIWVTPVTHIGHHACSPLLPSNFNQTGNKPTNVNITFWENLLGSCCIFTCRETDTPKLKCTFVNMTWKKCWLNPI